MIYGAVKKIMFTGITKYANLYDADQNNVQIKVTDDPNGHVNFTICIDFEDKEDVQFLQIMDKKFDFMQFEAISCPYLKKALYIFAKEYDVDPSNAKGYIMKYKDTIALAFYDSHNKNLKNILLSKQLQELGIGT